MRKKDIKHPRSPTWDTEELVFTPRQDSGEVGGLGTRMEGQKGEPVSLWGFATLVSLVSTGAYCSISLGLCHS
jgi:hypothetical protein